MNHTYTKVTVRQRAIRNDRISLYLDYYPAVRNPKTMQMSRREYLGIYIYAHPKNEMEREFNNDMLNKAEAIRCIRVQSLINEEFGFLDKHKMKMDFLAYFLKMARTKDQKWLIVYAHFSKFVQGKCTFGELNVALCKRFRSYLLSTHQLKRTKLKVDRNKDSIAVIRKRVETYERLVKEQAEKIERARLNAKEAERLEREVESVKSRK